MTALLLLFLLIALLLLLLLLLHCCCAKRAAHRGTAAAQLADWMLASYSEVDLPCCCCCRPSEGLLTLQEEQQHRRRFHSNCDAAHHLFPHALPQHLRMMLQPAGSAALLALQQPSEHLQAQVPSLDG
jgi:hypothetical protein